MKTALSPSRNNGPSNANAITMPTTPRNKASTRSAATRIQKPATVPIREVTGTSPSRRRPPHSQRADVSGLTSPHRSQVFISRGYTDSELASGRGYVPPSRVAWRPPSRADAHQPTPPGAEWVARDRLKLASKCADGDEDANCR